MFHLQVVHALAESFLYSLVLLEALYTQPYWPLTYVSLAQSTSYQQVWMFCLHPGSLPDLFPHLTTTLALQRLPETCRVGGVVLSLSIRCNRGWSSLFPHLPGSTSRPCPSRVPLWDRAGQARVGLPLPKSVAIASPCGTIAASLYQDLTVFEAVSIEFLSFSFLSWSVRISVTPYFRWAWKDWVSCQGHTADNWWSLDLLLPGPMGLLHELGV